MTTYDYDLQAWVKGEQGARVRLAQLRKELAIMQSARGPEYLRFIGSKQTQAEAIKHVQAAMQECEAEL